MILSVQIGKLTEIDHLSRLSARQKKPIIFYQFRILNTDLRVNIQFEKSQFSTRFTNDQVILLKYIL